MSGRQQHDELPAISEQPGVVVSFTEEAWQKTMTSMGAAFNREIDPVSQDNYLIVARGADDAALSRALVFILENEEWLPSPKRFGEIVRGFMPGDNGDPGHIANWLRHGMIPANWNLERYLAECSRRNVIPQGDAASYYARIEEERGWSA